MRRPGQELRQGHVQQGLRALAAGLGADIERGDRTARSIAHRHRQRAEPAFELLIAHRPSLFSDAADLRSKRRRIGDRLGSTLGKRTLRQETIKRVILLRG